MLLGRSKLVCTYLLTQILTWGLALYTLKIFGRPTAQHFPSNKRLMVSYDPNFSGNFTPRISGLDADRDTIKNKQLKPQKSQMTLFWGHFCIHSNEEVFTTAVELISFWVSTLLKCICTYKYVCSCESSEDISRAN